MIAETLFVWVMVFILFVSWLSLIGKPTWTIFNYLRKNRGCIMTHGWWGSREIVITTPYGKTHAKHYPVTGVWGFVGEFAWMGSQERWLIGLVLKSQVRRDLKAKKLSDDQYRATLSAESRQMAMYNYSDKRRP